MITAVVGSGGKTTLIHRLAKEYQSTGRRVLVTTSTHMWLEDGAVLTGRVEDIAGALERTGYVMAGTQEGEKLAPLPPKVYEAACRLADEVLVEADGSKGLPVKFPESREPVIDSNVDRIIVVCNLSALGKPIVETVHRPQLAADSLGVPLDTILTAGHVQTLLRKGYVEPLRAQFSGKKVCIHANHDGSPYQRAVAALLEKEQEADVPGLKEVMGKYRLGCVVLAAGKSTRFGGQKLLAELNGAPLLAQTLDSVPKGLFARTVAVVSDQRVAELCVAQGVETVFYPGGSQSESIRRGVKEMEGLDGCLFLPGDQPLCRSFGALVGVFDDAQPIRLAHNGVAGSPVLYPAEWFSRLAGLTGDVGGASLLRGVSTGLVEGEARELLDADTPEALSVLESEFREKGLFALEQAQIV